MTLLAIIQKRLTVLVKLIVRRIRPENKYNWGLGSKTRKIKLKRLLVLVQLWLPLLLIDINYLKACNHNYWSFHNLGEQIQHYSPPEKWWNQQLRLYIQFAPKRNHQVKSQKRDYSVKQTNFHRKQYQTKYLGKN